MSTKRFEQLIEFVINDDEQKARELFHEIVVEKSREIYESLMDDEFSQDVDGFAGNIEADEEGFDDEEGVEGEFDSEGEFDGEFDSEGEAEEVADEIEDRLVDVEDKLDELMAEFDALMADGNEGEFDDEGEGSEFDDEGEGSEFDGEGEGSEFDGEEEYNAEGLSEEVKLTPVAKPSNADVADNKRSVSLQNSGKGGPKAGGNPIKTDTAAETGRTAPAAKGMGVAGPQDAGKGAFKSKAPAAAKGEAAGTDTKSVVRK